MSCDICDFQRSFLAFTVPNHANTARIQIDARCRVTDDGTPWREYVLITPCKSENTYAKDHLLQDPNYDFFGVFESGGEDPEYVIWRTFAEHDPNRVSEHEAGKSAKRFAEVDITIGTLSDVTPLRNAEEIVTFTRRNHPLVARTTIHRGNRTAELEYPVKTINIVGTDTYQVDTGPIIVPSWIRNGNDTVPRGPLAIEQLDAAFIVYNQFDRTEFVLRQPTALTSSTPKNGAATVWHYAEIVEIAAEHRFYAGS